jgi:hypothetical protein
MHTRTHAHTLAHTHARVRSCTQCTGTHAGSKSLPFRHTRCCHLQATPRARPLLSRVPHTRRVSACKCHTRHPCPCDRSSSSYSGVRTHAHARTTHVRTHVSPIYSTIYLCCSNHDIFSADEKQRCQVVARCAALSKVGKHVPPGDAEQGGNETTSN